MANYQPLVTQIPPPIYNYKASAVSHVILSRLLIMQKKFTILHLQRNGGFYLSTLLFWCASAVYAPTQAAVATATVNANVIASIGITSLSGLSFGDISASGIAGTIVMSPDGTRTATGGTTFNSAVAGNPATFDIQGEANSTYSILLPASISLTDASSNNMVVDNFTSVPTPAGVLDGSGQQTLLVGATLNIGSNQAFGSYSGIMSVTVVYN